VVARCGGGRGGEESAGKAALRLHSGADKGGSADEVRAGKGRCSAWGQASLAVATF
jgi:hypothetical protein